MTDAQQPIRVLRVERDLPWLPPGGVCTTVLSPILPPRTSITMAAAFAFDGDRLLLVDLVERGWDIPGGHLEAGEDPVEAVRREAYEEAGARLDRLRLFAHNHIRLSGVPQPEHPYPYPESAIVFYLAQVTWLDLFTPTAESRGRGLFDPAAAREVPWVQRHRELYEAAFGMALEGCRCPLRR
jgi:8-oxo-dGTP pyrophosphatase MutT (NUDIX family)